MDKRQPVTKERERQIFSFPDLVYKELLAILVSILILTIWSLTVDAPLKSVANPNWTENPAKAPWYFVGLQELLVYFDPWIAGVMIPTLIIFGLILLPYLDPNPEGIGYYCFRKRRLIIPLFLLGYMLWFGLIFIGQFFRGPNWQFYWPWENWNTQKSAEKTLINLPLQWGLSALILYWIAGLVVPTLIFKGIHKKMGTIRYVIAFSLVLSMIGVVIKILLRLLFHVKYIITAPYFNI